MYHAIYWAWDIAVILESKGAACTENEISQLGKQYTNFISYITDMRDSEKNKKEIHNPIVDKLINEVKDRETKIILLQTMQLQVIGKQNEELELEIEKLKEVILEKDRINLQNQLTIQENQAIIEEKEACIQQKDRILLQNQVIMEQNQVTIQEKEESIRQKENKIRREEQMKMQLWKFKQNQVQKINNFLDLQLISKIAHGCDAVVFNCSALHLGISSVALKILFNFGINTSRVSASFANEFAILKELPFHPNIIPIWKEFHDRPTQPFIDLFPPDLKPLVVNDRTDTVRTTTCIVMPILESFEVFFNREFKNVRVNEKLAFIADILSGLVFLFENDVVHRDMKLNNLLINSTGRIIISDFGCSSKLLPDKSIYISSGRSIGGNPVRLAPEIKRINTSLLEGAVKVDYSKQPSFELGMIAFEIFFGDIPESHMFGEHMDDAYFNNLCVDDSHKLPEMFEWLRGLLYSDPQRRTALFESVAHFNYIQDKF